MEIEKKTKRDYKATSNKGMTYSTSKNPILCDKGHELDKVYARTKRGSSFKVLPIMYCPTCSKFFQFSVKEVKL